MSFKVNFTVSFVFFMNLCFYENYTDTILQFTHSEYNGISPKQSFVNGIQEEISFPNRK